MDDAERGANARISVDLEAMEIRGPDGGMVKFEVDAFRRQCLLNGWDDIGLTLRDEDKITAYEARHKADAPWL
jgi:3-isopropylmalate/(R)-2-methylmalate dehydratase small subunit